MEEENKRLRARVEELLNELKSSEITKSQFNRDFTQEKLSLQEKLDESKKENEALRIQLDEVKQELVSLREKSVQV